MSFDPVDFDEANRLTRGNKFKSFAVADDGKGGADRIALDFPEIHHTPKFKFDKSDVFFTIGSCFARNLEKQLAKLGVENLTSKCVFDGDLYNEAGLGGRNGALNAYTPKSMLDLIRLNKREDRETAGIVQTGDDEFYDMMTSGLRQLTETESREVRGKILDVYRSISEAKVVVVTLGYTESWLDSVDNIHTNRSPGGTKKLMRLGERFSFFNDSPVSTFETVDAIINEIHSQTNGNAKIIITTSPVPLHRTWVDRDVASANLYSKSTLLSAATYAASLYDFVDYFPSYELVTYTPRSLAWKEDGIHVNPKVVEKVIGQFSDSYFN